MRKANVKIDISNNTIGMLDQKVNIAFASCGHYAVPISKTNLINQLVDDFDRNNQVAQVYLYRSFASVRKRKIN